MKPAKQFRIISKKYYNESNIIFHTNFFSPTNEELGDIPDISKVSKIEYKRHIIPRVKEKDNEIDENVTLDFVKRAFYFSPVFPEKPDPTYLPFFYPKVLEFSISYQPTTNTTISTTPKDTSANATKDELVSTSTDNTVNNNDNDNNDAANKNKSKSKLKKEKKQTTKQSSSTIDKPIIAVVVMQARFFDQITFRAIMHKVGKEVLEKLDKWGIKNDLPGGYTKLANYDMVVPRDLYFSTYERLKKTHRHWADAAGSQD